MKISEIRSAQKSFGTDSNRYANPEYMALCRKVGEWFKSVSKEVNTTELTVGDYVFTHNALFQLTSKNESHGVVWCKTKVVKYSKSPEFNFPKSWQNDWTIQGNNLARWTVITNPEEFIEDFDFV